MREPSRPHESPLMRLVQIASALGAAKVADEAFELAARVADGRFFCACVGQYKRGKSTFLNALIGEPILPVGVIPVTSAITVILHGKRRSARVRFQDGNVLQIAPGELRDYVAEEENPGNAKQVALIELFWPSPLLATGLCLVDTPGVGSIYAWNTEVTKTFVPQVDAALVLLGADPPLSELELELVDQFARQTTTLLFALNKSDRMAPSEISEAREFTQRALGSRLARADLRIYQVSATERLLGKATRDWAELEAELAYLAQSSAQALVQRAQQRGVERFAALLKHEVAVRLEALQKPLHEQDAKLEAAESEIVQAERSIPMLFLENAEDQLRMDSDLERRRDAFLKAAVPRARVELEKALAAAQVKGPALQTSGVQASRKIALTLLDVWSKELSRLIEANFREVMERMIPYAHDFVRRVSPSSMATFKELRKAVDVTAGPALPPALAEPTFRPSKIPEAVLWTEAGVKLQVDELAGYLRRLVDTSSILMSRQARERYREKQRKLEGDLRAWMADVASLATRALERSRDMHRAGSEAVRAETERLRMLPPELDALVTIQTQRTAAAVNAPARGPGRAVGMPHDEAVRVAPVPVGQQVTQPLEVLMRPAQSQPIAGAAVVAAQARAAAAAAPPAPVPVASTPAPPSRPRMAMPALDIPVPRTTPAPPPVAGPPGVAPEAPRSGPKGE
ncbi:MAG TPA: dynamin family protein [Myxococcaceae bacterium]|nr:dynamin family protein [Myxococcaceae bacterium]